MTLFPPSNTTQNAAPYGLLVRIRALSTAYLFSDVLRLGLHNDQVFRGVIEFVPVTVMDGFALTQFAAEHLFGNDAMNRPAPDLEVVLGSCCLVPLSAINGAESSAPLPGIAWAKVEGCATFQASELLSESARDRIARLRAPLASAWLTARLACIHAFIIARNRDKTALTFSPHCLKPPTLFAADELSRCAAEQSQAAPAAESGDRGAILGVSDWMAEEAMIRGDNATTR